VARVIGLLWKSPWDTGKTFTTTTKEMSWSEAKEAQVRIVLDKELTYAVGIDQSGKCVGVAIADVDFSVVLIMDIIRDFRSSGGVDGFYRELYEFLGDMLFGITLSYFAMEQIPPVYYTQYVNKYLAELRGTVKGWIPSIPALSELDHRYIFDILPAQWKHYVYIKPRGKAGNRFYKKDAIAWDICVKFPFLIPHLNVNKMYGTSQMEYDSFDAFGILYGAKCKFFDEEGYLVNAATKKNIQSIILYRYVKYPIDDVAELFDGLNEYAVSKQIAGRQYNPEYSVMDNVYMSLGNKEAPWVMMEVTSPMHLLGVAIEFNLRLQEGYVMFMFVGAVNKIKQSVVNYLLSGNFMAKYIS
jgi:hypothetical protein